jgi:signal transduction histidine kinase
VSLTWSNIAVALVWAIVAALAAWLLAWPLRRQSLGWLMLSVTLTGTAASAGALLGAVHTMLIPTGDELALVVLTIATGLLASAGALAASRRIAREHRAVRDAVTQLGRGEVPSDAQPGLSRNVQSLQAQVSQTAEALRTARERERALERSRRELVAWVSHDLRTPLAGLRAISEALEDGLADDPELYYKQISAAVQRLSGMVDDLFDLSRIQAGTVVRGTDPVDLRALVGGCVVTLEPLAVAKRVTLAGTLADPRPGATVLRGNAAELDRALTNVVANAIRHTPENGRVDVLLEHADGSAAISIDDQCGGIAADVLPRVFDVGFRGTTSRTPGVDGARAGLGLAITHGIIEAHDGTVTVENTDSGCRFRLLLPLS